MKPGRCHPRPQSWLTSLQTPWACASVRRAWVQQLGLRPQAERWGPLSQEGQGREENLSRASTNCDPGQVTAPLGILTPKGTTEPVQNRIRRTAFPQGQPGVGGAPRGSEDSPPPAEPHPPHPCSQALKDQGKSPLRKYNLRGRGDSSTHIASDCVDLPLGS